MKSVVVWDPLVRIGHWLLVLLFAVAYIVEDDFLTVHSWAGYGIATVVAFRILWGLVGTRHARFSDFIAPPRAVFGYLADLIRFRAPRHLGHSPAGGAMTVALLLSLALSTGSGMWAYAVRYERGPLVGYVTAAPTQPPPEHDVAKKARKQDKRGALIKELHEIFVNLTLVLIALHLGGVALASLAHRENLPRSMITGRKRADQDAAPPPSGG